MDQQQSESSRRRRRRTGRQTETPGRNDLRGERIHHGRPDHWRRLSRHGERKGNRHTRPHSIAKAGGRTATTKQGEHQWRQPPDVEPRPGHDYQYHASRQPARIGGSGRVERHACQGKKCPRRILCRTTRSHRLCRDGCQLRQRW